MLNANTRPKPDFKLRAVLQISIFRDVPRRRHIAFPEQHNISTRLYIIAQRGKHRRRQRGHVRGLTTTASNGEYANQFSLHSPTGDSARKLCVSSGFIPPRTYRGADALLSLLARTSAAHWLPIAPEICTASMAMSYGGQIQADGLHRRLGSGKSYSTAPTGRKPPRPAGIGIGPSWLPRSDQSDHVHRRGRLREINCDVAHRLGRGIIQFQPVRPTAPAPCPASRNWDRARLASGVRRTHRLGGREGSAVAAPETPGA